MSEEIVKEFKDVENEMKYSVKRIADVRHDDLLNSWLTSPDAKLEPVLDKDGFVDIRETIDKLLKSSVLNSKAIPLIYKSILTDIAAGTIPYIEGVPGTGKSECAKIICSLLNKLGIKSEVIILILASMEPSDLVGERVIPSSSASYTINVVSEELYQIRKQKDTAYIIFLDEINRAMPHMITASMKLFDGNLNPRYNMTSNTFCMSAGNLGSADGTEVIEVEEMDSAFVERIFRYRFSPDGKSWILLNKSNPEIDPSLIDKIEKSIDSDHFKNFVFCNHKYRPFSPRRLTMILMNLSKKREIFSKAEMKAFIETLFVNKNISEVVDEKGHIIENAIKNVPTEYRAKIKNIHESLEFIKQLLINWADGKEFNASLINIFNYGYKPADFIKEFKEDRSVLSILKEAMISNPSDTHSISIRESLDEGFKHSNITVEQSKGAEFSVFAIKHYKKVIEKLYDCEQLKNDILTNFNNFMSVTFKSMLGNEVFKSVFFNANITTVNSITEEYVKQQFKSKVFLEKLSNKNFKELFAVAIATMEDENSLSRLVSELRNEFQAKM